jgi:ComF family protein
MGLSNDSNIEERNRYMIAGMGVDALRAWVRNWALPERCVLCSTPGTTLCGPCREDLPGWHAARCPVCAHSSPRAEVCGQCLAHPPRFNRVSVAFSYGFPADALIRRLKYASDLALVAPLARLLFQRVAGEARPDCIVPMPLSRQRLCERGFNQSLELARVLAAHLELPVATAVARRIRDTPPQATLPLDRRRANIRGAFECDDMHGARVAVVDDVLTSGATLNELARALLRAGATEVSGWVLARTERA